MTGKSKQAPNEKEGWWDLEAGLLEKELGAIEAASVSCEVLHQANGVFIVEALWPVEGRSPIKLQIGFSQLHPFFRPVVTAPEEAFSRHQDPFSKTLCLLTQDSYQWDPNRLVADFITERLPHLITAVEAREQGGIKEASSLEENVPDPLMPYFEHQGEPNSTILFDGSVTLPTVPCGLMEVINLSSKGLNPDTYLKAAVKNLQNLSGRVISKSFFLPPPYNKGAKVPGRWVRLDQPPPNQTPEEFMSLVEAELAKQTLMQPKLAKKVKQVAEAPLSVTGVLFNEEIGYQEDDVGLGMLFLVSRISASAKSKKITFVSGARAAKTDLFSRFRPAQLLQNKSAVIIGCGAIGSFAAIELARAGIGKVSLWDFDIVKPGNSLRWPLGFPAWGLRKSEILADFIHKNYPWTEVSFQRGKVGAAIADSKAPELKRISGSEVALLEKTINSAELIIDTAASSELHHALSFLCRRQGVPYILGYATLGLAGGVVARFLPNAQGCWVCLQEHWKDKNIPRPRVDEEGEVIPVGCNAPTFSGGAFDLQEVSLEIVRSAVGLLSEGEYDLGEWPLAVLELKDSERKRLLPRWKTLDLPPHPRCCGGT